MDDLTSANKNSENSITPEKIQYLKSSFEHAQQLAEFADSKAGILLTIHAGLLAIITGASFINDIREKISTITDFFVILIILFFLGLSTYFAIRVIMPREAFNKESLFFYKKIADYKNESEYYETMKNSTLEDIAKAYANQAYEVSKIASEKMNGVKNSIITLVIYFICLAIGSLLVYYF